MKSGVKVLALVLLLGGCGGEDTTVPLNGPLAAGTGSDPSKPTTNPATGGTTAPNDPAGKPSAGCNTPPPADPVKCWAEETKEGTCKVCVDATGKEIVRSCDQPGDPAAGLKCFEEKGKDGELCKVCVDPTTGKEALRSCAGPAPADVKCFEKKGKEGEVCKICVDATGKEIARGCSGPNPGDPGPAVKCEEFDAGGTICKVCYDAHGSAVSKECAVR